MPARGWLQLAAFVLLLATARPGVAEDAREPLETMIARADAARDNQDELYAQVVQREVEMANDDFTAGEVERAQARVKAAVSHGEKSLAAAKRTRKRLKETEILFRKISRRLNDIGHTLAVEDQPAVFAAVERLEQIRSDLLAIMFAPPEKEKKPSS